MEFDDNLNPVQPQSSPTPPPPAPAPMPTPITPQMPPSPGRSQNPLVWVISLGIIVILVGGFVWSNWQPGGSTTTNNGYADGLNVSAEGVVYATPDIAKLRLGVSQIGREAATVQEDVTKKIDAIKSKITEMGVEEKDIKTVEFGIYPDYGGYPTTDASRIRSYTGRHILEVKIRDLDKAKQISDAAITAGANEVQNIEFTVEDPEKWYQEARTQAISKAKDKAKQLAEAANIRLGRLVSINESSNTTPIYYDKMIAPGGYGGGGADSGQLSEGSLELHAYVTLVYRIK